VNAIKMEEELLEARALLTTYKVMEDNTQELERQNRNLKKCLCGNTDSNFFALRPQISTKTGNLRFGNK
jgi:hypothetical protein